MNQLTNLQHEAQQITLSSQEKALMRAQLFGTPQAAPRYQVSHFQFFSIKFAPVMAAVLVVLLGGGTAYAAQGALPGELLYSVKVGVNEPVRQALAVSTEAKAAFHTSVAQTRLEEAETLAAKGKLDATAGATIETSLDLHLARAEEITEKLEEEEKTDLAFEVEAELDSALSAHSAILAKIGEESEDEETKEHSSSLAGRITSRIFARVDSSAGKVAALKAVAPAMESVSLMTADATSTSDVALTTTNTTTNKEASRDSEQESKDERAAAALRLKAAQAVADARKTFDTLKASLEATTTARVEAQFKTLESQLADGVNLYDDENYSAARATFSAVLGDVTELHAYLRAEKKFNKKYLRSWVDSRFGAWLEPEVRGLHTDHDHDEEDQDEDTQHKDGDFDGDDEDDKDKTASSSVDVKVRLGL